MKITITQEEKATYREKEEIGNINWIIYINELKGTEEINTEISTQQPTGGVTDNLKIK